LATSEDTSLAVDTTGVRRSSTIFPVSRPAWFTLGRQTVEAYLDAAAYALPNLHALSEASAVSLRHPFLDRRFAEAALGVDPALLRDRHLHREMIRYHVPTEIVERRAKADFSWFWIERLRHGDVRSLPDRLPADWPIDHRALSAAIDKVMTAADRDTDSQLPEVGHLGQLLSAIQFREAILGHE